jgi:hypothetical protein
VFAQRELAEAVNVSQAASRHADELAAELHRSEEQRFALERRVCTA